MSEPVGREHGRLIEAVETIRTLIAQMEVKVDVAAKTSTEVRSKVDNLARDVFGVAVLETKLKGLEDGPISALKKEVNELRDHNKWLVRLVLGTLITTLMGAALVTMKMLA